jgi:heptosyltransferase-2
MLEFWGLGDLTFSTPLIQAARGEFEVTLVGKEHSRKLLEPSFPEVEYIRYEAPWSAYHGKYAIWKWNWPQLIGLISRLRREKFDAAVSVRNDPRDHLLMWLVGARKRYGFPRRGSHVFLTDPVKRTLTKQHKVQDWRDLGQAIGLPAIVATEPHLTHAQYRTELGDRLFGDIKKPVICLHPGARIDVRRWPETYFAQIIAGLREAFDFHFILIPDPDGYGSSLAPMADTVLRPLTVPELVDVLGRVDVLLCNDSGPGHLAATSGRPVIVICGPTDPDWFRPWGKQHHVVVRDICPLRPCFDYCAFSQPFCLTRLTPNDAWPEVYGHISRLIDDGVVTKELRRAPAIEASTAVAPPLPRDGKMDGRKFSIAFSIADQNVATTKSIGIYNFSLHLLKELAVHPRKERLSVFTNETIKGSRVEGPGIEVFEENYPVRSRTGRIWWDQRGVYERAQRTDCEWLFLPKGFLSFASRPKIKVAAFVHDIMGDYYRRNYPEFWSKLEFDYFARSLAATIRTAEVIFTNTEFTKGEIWGLARRLGLPVPKVIVAGYGFDIPPAVEPGSVVKENRVLLFASNMPHKRTDIAIKFLDHWAQVTGFDGTVDCIGIIPPDMKKPPGKHWNWIGRVPPAQGREMIRQSRAIVYVSEHEGFGMPPVEAVLEGTCPVYSNLPPIMEVMAGAGHGFSNESPESFVAAMEQALVTPAESIRQWREQLITRHNWPNVTAKIVDELAS